MTRRRFHLILCLGLTFISCVSYGQKVKLNKGNPVNKTYFASVPYEEVQDKIIIPVEIQGNTYRFLFDTGAPNLITESLSKLIDSKPINSINVRDANGDRNKMQVISLPLVGIGTAFFEDVPTLISSDKNSFIFDCFEVHGIIGSNMVRKSVVHLDSEKFLFQISDAPDSFEVSGQEELKMTLSKAQSSPHIWIGLEGDSKGKADEYVLFDTGMEDFYDLSVTNYPQLEGLQVFENIETGTGAQSIGIFNDAEADEHYRADVSKITIGKSTFHNVPTITMGADRSRIGSALLDYGKVTLDFGNKRFYFHPFSKDFDLTEAKLGFSPTIKDEAIVVGIVWEDELGERLNYGDKIVRINGLDIENMNPCDFINQDSPFDSANPYLIRFKSLETGEEFELELKKN